MHRSVQTSNVNVTATGHYRNVATFSHTFSISGAAREPEPANILPFCRLRVRERRRRRRLPRVSESEADELLDDPDSDSEPDSDSDSESG